jgi:hypothetical protein
MRRTRDALRSAIDRAVIARGELQWTNGYRCAYEYHRPVVNPVEVERLTRKERGQLAVCEAAEQAVERAMGAYARAIRGGR